MFQAVREINFQTRTLEMLRGGCSPIFDGIFQDTPSPKSYFFMFLARQLLIHRSTTLTNSFLRARISEQVTRECAKLNALSGTKLSAIDAAFTPARRSRTGKCGQFITESFAAGEFIYINEWLINHGWRVVVPQLVPRRGINYYSRALPTHRCP